MKRDRLPLIMEKMAGMAIDRQVEFVQAFLRAETDEEDRRKLQRLLTETRTRQLRLEIEGKT